MPYTPLRSPADVVAHLRVGESREDDYLEFKGPKPYPDPRSPKDKSECSLDIAQFANALGGVIVIGATEVDNVLAGFRSVKKPEVITDWIERVAADHLRPVPRFDLQVVTLTTGEHIVIVNVDPHQTLVAEHGDKRYQFVSRVGTSKHYLEMDELEARMQGRERLMRFRLDQIPPDAQIGVDAKVRKGIGHYDWRMIETRDDVVLLEYGPGRQVVVPLSAVQDVYRADEPQADWIIRLSCFIVRNKITDRVYAMMSMPHGSDPTTFVDRVLPE